MSRTLMKFLAAAIALAPSLLQAQQGAVLLDQVNLVGLPTVAQPSQFSFTAATAQALTVTLTDFQVPAAFTSLQVAVTVGNTLVGQISVLPGTHTATLPVPAAAGNYTLNVIGAPAIVAPSTQGSGSFGVCVAPASNATSCIAADSFSGNIQTPSTTPTGTSTLNTAFTSTVAGNYTVTLTDDAFPMALQTLSAGILQGATPVQVGILPCTPTPPQPCTSAQVQLAANTNYELLVAAVANASVQAGLYGIQITDPNGNPVFNSTQPVGTLPAATIVDNTSTQGLNLTLTDFAYPAALAGVGVAITEGSTSLTQLTAQGSLSNVMAPAGSISIWQYGLAGAQPGVYGVNLSSTTAGTSLFSATKVVNPAGVAGQSYAFAVNLPSAGTYTLVANDFQFPLALQSLSSTVAQNGAVLTQSSAGSFTAAAGYVVVVVDAVPPQNGNGIFGVTVETSGATPQILLDQTQAVGGVFSTNSVTVPTSGSYAVTLTDLAFPAAFDNLAVVLSSGSQVLGKIYGGGTFSVSATPGPYVLTFVATPNSAATNSQGTSITPNYGLYSIVMATSAPTVTFSASAASVPAGQTVQLTWSSTNATSCTAAGTPGWSGSEMTSGSTAVIINANVSLTLTCTGAGGSASQSVMVATTAATSSGGGGGAVDWWMLAVLGVWTGMRRTVVGRRSSLTEG
jgi:plastocyanin